MENLIFSLNATMPVFIMIVIGFCFRKINWISEPFAAQLNKFVFRCALPVMLFKQMATTDIVAAFDAKFVLFCFGVTVLSIAIAIGCSFLFCKGAARGEFVQASYRSSAAILGIAYITNIYGQADLAPQMILGSVPLYNVMAVVMLAVFAPRTSEAGDDALRRKEMVTDTIKGILTNGIIIGIFSGMFWSLLRLPIPAMAGTVLGDIGKLATPLGLLSMGAQIDPSKVGGKLKPAIAATFLKLVGWEIVFMPLAVLSGFRTQKLVAILVMLGSPTTITSYIMARNMRHEGTLSSNTVVLTTLFGSFTLMFWVWLLKTLGLL